MPKLKVQSVQDHPRKQAIEVQIEGTVYEFPYHVLDPKPTSKNPIVSVQRDRECSLRGFVYRLASGEEGGVMADDVLEFYDDPRVLYENLLHQLNTEAIALFRKGHFSKRGLARRLGTSVSQIDRLLDTRNTRKSIDSMLELIAALGGRVEIQVSVS